MDRDLGRSERRPLGLFGLVGTIAAIALLAALTGASSGAPPVRDSADVSVTKSDSPDPVVAGSPIAYSIQVRNAGPATATHVVVTDKLPSGVTFVSSVPTQGTCEPSSNKRQITCRLGTIGMTASPTYV